MALTVFSEEDSRCFHSNTTTAKNIYVYILVKDSTLHTHTHTHTQTQTQNEGNCGRVGEVCNHSSEKK